MILNALISSRLDTLQFDLNSGFKNYMNKIPRLSITRSVNDRIGSITSLYTQGTNILEILSNNQVTTYNSNDPLVFRSTNSVVDTDSDPSEDLIATVTFDNNAKEVLTAPHIISVGDNFIIIQTDISSNLILNSVSQLITSTNSIALGAPVVKDLYPATITSIGDSGSNTYIIHRSDKPIALSKGNLLFNWVNNVSIEGVVEKTQLITSSRSNS